MKKLFLSAILLTIITLTGQAKQSAIVWANPTVEYTTLTVTAILTLPSTFRLLEQIK